MNPKISLVFGIAVVLVTGVVTISALPLSVSGNNGMIYQQQQQQPVYANHGGMKKPGEYAAGTIASLQNDKNSKPAWIVSGFWKGSLTNLTSEMLNNPSNATNKKNLPIAEFDAVFSMVMLNGSAMHKHQIYNFTLTDISMPNEKTVVYNGTATITMKDGPVKEVPLSIRTMANNVISIQVDPTKTNNHFGNTPIYGTITDDVLIRK